MRLAQSLFLGFTASGLISIAGLGLFVRGDRHDAETQRFDREVDLACTNVKQELVRQAEADRRLIGGACQSGELADRVAVSLESGAPSGMELGWRQTVPKERDAFGFDELTLATTDGRVIGADPETLADTPKATLVDQLSKLSGKTALRVGASPAIATACVRPVGRKGGVGFLASRYLLPLLTRVAPGLGVAIRPGDPDPKNDSELQRSCVVSLGDSGATGATLPLVVARDRRELTANLGRIDQAIGLAALVSAALALILAALLSRRLGRPLALLSAQARKVADGDAQPIKVHGSGEIAELAKAFDTMLVDLAATRRRLAATNRVAAWREVARRVAHEVKNPLAPIRAAVETLRRLRAREDPRFDEYFDEATRTVLEEVHRIAGIVTEFTRFARLPPPRPEAVDLQDIVKTVLRREEARAGSIALRQVVPRTNDAGHLSADRDQLLQVLINLVQNALEAMKDLEHGEVVVTTGGDATFATITVDDSGPGIDDAFAPRLFEPYATTKSSGTGLGLAIAQRIAVDHGGELSYVGKSSLGGASFRVSLPREGPPASSERASARLGETGEP